MGKLFGSEIFDPKYIVSQILLLQAMFYLIHFTLTGFLNHVFGLANHLDQIFSSSVLINQDSYGLVFILSSLLSIPLLVCAIVYIVERTSKCLDFTGTIYFFHLIFVSYFSSVPTNLAWWGVNGGSLILVILLSEYICMKIERQEISLNFPYKKEKIEDKV